MRFVPAEARSNIVFSLRLSLQLDRTYPEGICYIKDESRWIGGTWKIEGDMPVSLINVVTAKEVPPI
jgi:hypothetical protein